MIEQYARSYGGFWFNFNGTAGIWRRKAMEDAKENGDINFHDLKADENVCKVSVVGIGMRSHAGVAAQMFDALSTKGINIQVITTSEIKISVLIDRDMMELAVRTLHDSFGLDQTA